MSQSVNLNPTGPPETVLDAEPEDALRRLAVAEKLSGQDRRHAISGVVADYPRCLIAWAMLGEIARDDIEAYAAFRVGYHRGLDRLRANGWRGSGYVRWSQPTNLGFLRALDGLRRQAVVIGETDEAQRCEQFLGQLDPGGVPSRS